MEESVRKEIIEKILKEIPPEKRAEAKEKLKEIKKQNFKQSAKSLGLLVGITIASIAGFRLIWNYGFAETFRFIPKIGWSQAVSLTLSVPFVRWLSHFFQIKKDDNKNQQYVCVQCPMMDENNLIEGEELMGPPLADKDTYYG